MTLIERIGDAQQPPVIVAELSGNHAQSLDTAKRLVELAAKAGADAVKLQTYTADSLALPHYQEDFVIEDGLWKGYRLYDLYKKAATPYAWHKPLGELASERGIELFSSPFDEPAVDFLEQELDPPLYKVASFELTHLPLLKRIAKTRKPALLSAGMATESEIDEALKILRENGCPQVVLLKCISAYPSQPQDYNLRSMNALATRFGCHVGLSDHCLSNEVSLAAVALGARVIEKHFVDDRKAGGIDAEFSLEPDELAQLVQQSRDVHAALGEAKIGPTDQDAEQLMYRRSIYISQDIAQGETLSADNLKIVRPSKGLAPKRWDEVLGKKAKRSLRAGSPLQAGDWE